MSKAPRARNASQAPVSTGKPAKPQRTLVRIEDRIPAMTDGELKALHANAKRLAASGADAQRADAQRLLPIVSAEVDARAAAQAKALQERRETLREEKLRAKRARGQ